MYEAFKTLHIIGVTVLLGNVTVTAFWKVLSDRNNDVRLIRHAQHGVTVSDWIFTFTGIALIIIGGYGAAVVGSLSLSRPIWIVVGQVLFAGSGLVWLAVLVPIQIRQSRTLRSVGQGCPLPEKYRRDSRNWLIWGIVATVPLLAAIALMVAKPS